MSAQLSHTQTPAGGWQWYSPQTRWTLPNPVSVTFDQAVTLIMKHRLANPAITVQYKLATDFNSIAAELDSFTRSRLGLPPVSFPKQMPPPAVPQLSAGVAAAVANVKKLAAGAASLMEWDESGLPPVAPELSAKRAAICAVCQKNDRDSLSKYFTGPVADGMRKRLARLHEMKVSTPSDELLGTCSVCLCNLKLKCHQPFELIIKRLKPEMRTELDPACWILHETQ